MADYAVDTSVNTLLHRKSVRAGPVWIDVDTAYTFYVDDSDYLVYQKTTDGGATWSVPVTVNSGTVVKVSIWYDRWTPGIGGALIHMAYVEAGGDDLLYRNLNTLNDDLSTESTVIAWTGFVDGSWTDGTVDIVRARGGNLYMQFWSDTVGSKAFWHSDDVGATWSIRAHVADGDAVDGVLLMPGNESSENNIWCIYWDRSADELSLRIYDNSTNSWSETSIATSMADDASYYQMSAAPRHSDNHVILAAWSELDTATADLKVWDIGSSGSIVALTDVVTNLNNSAQVAVFINQQNNDIYVAYIKGDTWEATADVVYKKSSNGGITWGSEQTYSEASPDDIRALWAGISVGAGGGRFQPVFFNDDSDYLYINLVNDVAIAASVLPLRSSYAWAKL